MVEINPFGDQRVFRQQVLAFGIAIPLKSPATP
jgi:hypothetical protein